jgi:hypothetical protein
MPALSSSDIRNLLDSLDTQINELTKVQTSLAAELVQPNGAGNADEIEDGDPDNGSLPSELKKLKLKKVNVIIEDNAWNKLDSAAKAAIVKYLISREAYAKKNTKVKGYSFTLYGGDIGEVESEDLSAVIADAKANAAGVAKGKWKRQEPIGIVELGTTSEEVAPPPMASKPKGETFDAGSTFPSALYKAGDMNSAEFNKTMAQAADYLSKLQEDFGPEVKLKVTVEAGESQVTPPKGMKTGDLADLRAKTAIDQASKYFAAEGFDLSHIDFVPVTTLGSTPYIRGESDPDADCFTQEQYLKVTVEMSGEPKPLPPMIIEMTQLEGIFLKKKIDTRKKFEWPKPNWPKIRKRYKKPKRGGVDCPTW